MSVENELSFFDTNVLLYLFAAGDPRRDAAIRVSDQGGFISVQVLNEFISVSRRKLKLDWPTIEERLKRIHMIFQRVVFVTEEMQRYAVEIAKRYGFDIYDANIIAAALHVGCTSLYSEDMHDGQQIKGLTIRNPFTLPA